MDRDAIVALLTTQSFTGFDLATTIITTFALSLSLFYLVWYLGTSPDSAKAAPSTPSRATGNIGNHDVDDEEDWDEFGEDAQDDEDEDDSEPEVVDPSRPLLSKTAGAGEWKMVLCVRTDLEMGKGKAAAQCCHATLAAVRKIEKTDPKGLGKWERYGQAKVTLKCPSEDVMVDLQKQARAKGLVAESIRDAGRTQIAANSRTVLAVGPGPKKLIDEVTGHLKLY
ncbi:hypothetical protein CcCBS67573_g07631 [Chytriomyces confervae]|uniref:peptidyl-tRNA hydrolase n=1 Tax=Chytriomyces confervae TaxID=246404 RepID=A0A507ET37_9FUNG|nr:Peptidyl-tRNA hydrolase protein 2, mitochondrial [Chytriomyces hyalinus]TPX67031.1 hypothetical protein CcCBS67573_g07631 [Chytriomyces confervae]